MATDPYLGATAAAAELGRVMGRPRFDVAVVLGSGWGAAAEALGDPQASVAMADVPGFPRPAVVGHAGTIDAMAVGGRQVLVLSGRSHLYEGHDAATVVHGVRTAVLCGCSVVVLTNAAGSLRADWPVGTAVLLADHVNLTGHSPMVGSPPPEGYPARFVDLGDAYSRRMRAIALSVEPALPEGVYAALLGGAFETPAEIRLLRALGVDLVGMSTALETIAAVHLGAEVLGLSLVTNLAAGLSSAPIDHREVLVAGEDAAPDLGRLLRSFIERI